jgi:hypothetical protein
MMRTAGRMLVFTGPHQVQQAMSLPPLEPDQVCLCTLYAGLSADTKLNAYRGSNPYLHKRWQPAKLPRPAGRFFGSKRAEVAAINEDVASIAGKP